MYKGKFGLCALVIVGVMVLSAVQAHASPVVLEGRDINGHAVAYNDINAVFEYDPTRDLYLAAGLERQWAWELVCPEGLGAESDGRKI